jgi:hypothetical protein
MTEATANDKKSLHEKFLMRISASASVIYHLKSGAA